MKKNNNQGFILAEAIVVGIFVLSIFTFLFTNIVPLVGRYEAIENYDTLDAINGANLIRLMIMEDSNLHNVLKLNSGSQEGTYTYRRFGLLDEGTYNACKNSGEESCVKKHEICDGAIASSTNNGHVLKSDKNYCNKLLGSAYLDVRAIYITSYNVSGLKRYIKTHPKEFDRSFRDYVEYMPAYDQPSSVTYNNYRRVIVQYENDTFANLEIKISGV